MTAANDHALAATANAATIVDHPNLLHKILKKKKRKKKHVPANQSELHPQRQVDNEEGTC